MVKSHLLCPGCFHEEAGNGKCPRCGYDQSKKPFPEALPHLMTLHDRYLVGRVLGEPGGFGITYLCWDIELQRRVAIKEFFPRQLVWRAQNGREVAPLNADKGKIFTDNLKKFLEEARQIDKFDHPNLVRLRDYFRENNTAYLVMNFHQGISLAEYLSEREKIPELKAVEIVMQILEGLKQLHQKRLLHRDIKPQNIYLTREGQAILLDFGAARFAMLENRSLTVIVTPEFAPPEQRDRHGKQGPWTDIYACAVTLYTMITGAIPPSTLKHRPSGDISLGLYEVLKQAMAEDPKRRPRSVEEFQALLKKGEKAPRSPNWAWGLIGALLMLFGVIAILFISSRQQGYYESLDDALKNPASAHVLNLRKSGLDSLPSAVGKLVNLEELNLRYNQLTALPPEIARLRSLRKLDVAANQLKALPRDFGKLSSLADLDLSENEFQDVAAVSAAIGLLRNLQSLKLRECNLKDWSAKIFQLANLRVLDLSQNQIDVLPAQIGLLGKLQELRLESNAIKTLPVEIKNLKELTKLDLHTNQLFDLPEEMQQLRNLRELDLRANRIPESQRKSISSKLPHTKIKF